MTGCLTALILVPPHGTTGLVAPLVEPYRLPGTLGPTVAIVLDIMWVATLWRPRRGVFWWAAVTAALAYSWGGMVSGIRA
jgi:hypothetical protein